MGSKMDYHSYQDILIKGMSTQNSAGRGIDNYNRGIFLAVNLVIGIGHDIFRQTARNLNNQFEKWIAEFHGMHAHFTIRLG